MGGGDRTSPDGLLIGQCLVTREENQCYGRSKKKTKATIHTCSFQNATATCEVGGERGGQRHPTKRPGGLTELSPQARPGPPRPERPLTGVRGQAPADGEDLPEVLVLLRKALLQPLQLAQALAALVLHGAHVLDEVQLGLGGVAAQDAVVVAALAFHAALVLLQVLRGERRGHTQVIGLLPGCALCSSRSPSQQLSEDWQQADAHSRLPHASPPLSLLRAENADGLDLPHTTGCPAILRSGVNELQPAGQIQRAVFINKVSMEHSHVGEVSVAAFKTVEWLQQRLYDLQRLNCNSLALYRRS